MPARWLLALTLTATTASMVHADFPSDLYTPAPKGTCVTLDSECGCATGECRCVSGVCFYTDLWTENAHDRQEQVEDALAGASCVTEQMSCVLEPEDIDTAAELADLTETTGSGDFVQADTPALITPKIQSYASPAALPTAGTVDRVAFVEGASGDCTVGSGSDVCLCLDDGLDWITVGCGAATIATRTPFCTVIENPSGDDDNVILVEIDPAGTTRTLVRAWSHFTGACPTPPEFAFADAGGDAIGFTGGGNLTAEASATPATAITFSTSDADRVIPPGLGATFSTVNAPVCDDGSIPGTPATKVSVCVF